MDSKFGLIDTAMIIPFVHLYPYDADVCAITS